MQPSQNRCRAAGWAAIVPATRIPARAKLEKRPKPAERKSSRVISASTLSSMPGPTAGGGDRETVWAEGDSTSVRKEFEARGEAQAGWPENKKPAAKIPRAEREASFAGEGRR